MDIRNIRIPYKGRNRYGVDANGNTVATAESVSTFTTPNPGGNGNGGPMPFTPSEPTLPLSWNVINQVPVSTINYDDVYLLGNYVATLPINAFANVEATNLFIGDLQDLTKPNNGITGLVDGMYVDVVGNGTNEVYVLVQFTSAMTEHSGELRIPVNVNMATWRDVNTSTEAWKRLSGTNKCKTIDVTYSWTIAEKGQGGTAGPSTRGPIAWSSSLARRFSNGTGPTERDKEFVDIVMYGGTAYRCVISYTQEEGDSWANVSRNWVRDSNYLYVASDVQLQRGQTLNLDNENGIRVSAANRTVAQMDVNGVAATTVSGEKMYSNTYRREPLPGREQEYMSAPFAPFDMEIRFIADGAERFTVGEDGYWTFCGNSTNVLASKYPELYVTDGSFTEDESGKYVFCASKDDPTADYVWSGAVSASYQRKNNVLYFEIGE